MCARVCVCARSRVASVAVRAVVVCVLRGVRAVVAAVAVVVVVVAVAVRVRVRAMLRW